MSQVTSEGTPSIGTYNIRSRCNCGKVVVDVSLDQNDNTVSAINCHCKGCRRYHTGPFTSYLKTDASQVIIRRGKEKIGKFSSNCNELGPVERWYCVDCSSKIVSVPQPYSDDDAMKDTCKSWDCEGNESNKHDKDTVPKSKTEPVKKCLVNLGPVMEDVIPPIVTSSWKEQLERSENNLHFDDASVWVRARPKHISDYNYDARVLNSSLTWSGGCSCGACCYEFTLYHPVEIQHCYCQLCRTLSGSPFLSWIPVKKHDFCWKTTCVQEGGDVKSSLPSSLQIVRTTPFGCRHICSKCQSIMTIIYDEQPDLVWPCAGSLDDSSLPNDTEEMGKCLSRVCHICCRYHPTWLKTRDDGMERIEEAC